MTTIREPARDTPVLGEWDVVVLGGGPAGIAAAVAAARNGCSTLLVERYGFLGGMGTAAGVTNFCGLHANVHGEIRQVVHGVADDLLARIAALGGLNAPHMIFGKIAGQAYDTAAYKIAADELLADAGVEVLFHALAAGVVMDDRTAPPAVRPELVGGLGARASTGSARTVGGSADGNPTVRPELVEGHGAPASTGSARTVGGSADRDPTVRPELVEGLGAPASTGSARTVGGSADRNPTVRPELVEGLGARASTGSARTVGGSADRDPTVRPELVEGHGAPASTGSARTVGGSADRNPTVRPELVGGLGAWASTGSARTVGGSADRNPTVRPELVGGLGAWASTGSARTVGGSADRNPTVRPELVGGLGARTSTSSARTVGGSADRNPTVRPELVEGLGARASTSSARTVAALLIETKSGRQAAVGRAFIDASGDGDLAAWAGAKFDKGDGAGSMLYPSTMFRMNGVDPARAGEAWKVIPELMAKAEAEGRYRFPRKGAIVRPQKSGIEWRVNVTQLANAQGQAMDGTDARELSEAEALGRRQIASVATFLKEVPGFESSYIVDIAPQVGIRETRRVHGGYMLTEQDVLGCADFDDTIGVNGWPLELHVQGDVEFRWTPPGSRGFNQLPYRMIVPLVGAEPLQAEEAPSGGTAKPVGGCSFDNLWVAGRCASMTHEAQSAARVTGACFVMGQAAGTAAHLALRTGRSAADVDISLLQSELEAAGAFLGRGDARSLA